MAVRSSVSSSADLHSSTTSASAPAESRGESASTAGSDLHSPGRLHATGNDWRAHAAGSHPGDPRSVPSSPGRIEMQGRIRIGLAAAILATSCTSPQPGIKVRAANPGRAPVEIDAAEAQLALGNIGLALESFRKAARERPADVRALVGIAHAYERMGRFDLSQRWFETALAADPSSKSVLLAFAESLERQGLTADAASLRLEAMERTHAAELLNSPLSESVQDQAERSSDDARNAAIIPLPPPAPAELAQAPSEVKISSAPPIRTPARQTPRLERLSLGEVVLLTGPEPVWRAKLVSRSPKSATFRFVPIQPAPRLLNAARRQGLAARTRARLIDHGWTRIEIGDAPAVRAKTLVLFPEGQFANAKRLAAQLGSANISPYGGQPIIVLLGQDAARRKSLKPA